MCTFLPSVAESHWNRSSEKEVGELERRLTLPRAIGLLAEPISPSWDCAGDPAPAQQKPGPQRSGLTWELQAGYSFGFCFGVPSASPPSGLACGFSDPSSGLSPPSWTSVFGSLTIWYHLLASRF